MTRPKKRAAAFALFVLVGASSFAAPRRCDAQDNATFARQRHQHGVDLYEAGNYAAALDEFRASLGLYASPNSRLYLGRCLAALGRLPESVIEYERVAGEADERARTDPRYLETRDAARAELAEIAPRIGRLRVVVSAASGGREPVVAALRVAGRELPAAAAGLSTPVMPGHVALEVEAAGFATARRELDVLAGEEQRVVVALEPLAPVPLATSRSTVRTRPLETDWTGRTTAWVLLGTAAVGVTGGVVCQAFASAEYARLAAGCGQSGSCGRSDTAAGRALDTAGDVALVAGAAFAAAGIIVWLAAPPRVRRAQSSSANDVLARGWAF